MSDQNPRFQNVHEHIAAMRSALEGNPDCGTSHYNLAIALLGLNQFEEAERELYQAIECSPTLAEAYAQVGGLCLRRGDLDGCLDWNRRAVKARPGFSEGYGNIGFVQLQRGNVDEAIEALEKATHFNFRFTQALTTLGNAYLMAGRVEDSIKASLRALELQPEFAVAHNNLAIAYLEQDDFAKADHHMRLALKHGYAVAEQIQREIAAGLARNSAAGRD